MESRSHSGGTVISVEETNECHLFVDHQEEVKNVYGQSKPMIEQYSVCVYFTLSVTKVGQ